MKFLVLGVNGMAGHIVAAYLQEKGHLVVGFARKENELCETIIGDAENMRDLCRALNHDSYDCVINCIGILNKAVDADLTRGIYLNSILPHLLVDLLSNKKTKIIHISTDCIFESTEEYRIENSLADASSYYGRTKALGEINDTNNLTIRTSIIGPEIRETGIGLFHWFMHQDVSVFGYSNAIWTGVTTLELAKAIEKICTENLELSGVINLVNNIDISKYDLLVLFNKYFRNNKVIINEDNTFVCHKKLRATRTDVKYEVADYECMIAEMRDWICEHKWLYYDYKIE